MALKEYKNQNFLEKNPLYIVMFILMQKNDVEINLEKLLFC